MSRRAVVPFKPGKGDHDNEPHGRPRFVAQISEPGFAPVELFDGMTVLVLKRCEGENPADTYGRVYNLNVTRHMQSAYESNGRAPLRFIPEMQMIFPLRCLKLPMYASPITLDLGEVITINQSQSPATGIFKSMMWNGAGATNVCVGLSSWRSVAPTEAILQFAWQLVVLKHAAEAWKAAPRIFKYWAYNDMAPTVMLTGEASPTSALVTISIYEKFDATLDVYLRNYVRSLLSIADKGTSMYDYIDNLVGTLSGLMHSYLLQCTLGDVYTIASQASDYVLFMHPKVGTPNRLSVIGWAPDKIFNRQMLDVDIAAAATGTPFAPVDGGRHRPRDPGQANMFKTLLLRLRSQQMLTISMYAYQLFRMVLLNELVDVMEILRNELLRNIYADSATVTLESYDDVTERIRAMAQPDLTQEDGVIRPMEKYL